MKVASLSAAIATAAMFALAVVVSATAASPNGQTVAQTFHQGGTWVEYGDTDSCTGADINPTITGNEVEHITYFTNSDEAWGTFTEEGSVIASIDGLTYTGHIAFWGNFNQNERNANDTFTGSERLSATDGQGVVHYEVGHEVAHMTWDAVSDQPVVTFDKMTFTCT